MSSPSYASADQIARAVVAAARLLGADPELAVILKGGTKSEGHAKLLAFAVCILALPEACESAIARGLNFAYRANVAKQKIGKFSWWRDDWVDEVVGAILAPGIERAPEPEPEPERPPRPAPEPARVSSEPPARPEVDCLAALPRLTVATVRAFAAAGNGVAFIARQCDLPETTVRKILVAARSPRRAALVVPMGEPPPGRSALDLRGAK